LREHLLEVVEDQHQSTACVARDAAQVIGGVLPRNGRRQIDDAGRAHQLALEIAIAGQGDDGQVATGEHRRQAGPQQRRLADARRARQDDEVSGADDQSFQPRHIIGAAEERVGVPFLIGQERPEQTTG
jgi:hypothetical protein